MALIEHGTFNSNKKYFALNTKLIEQGKKVSKNNSKKLNKKNKTIFKDRYFRFQT